jgi:hypothetical protein
VVSSEVETDRSRQTDDLEKLLSLAEQLQDKYEIFSRRIEMYRFCQWGIGITLVAILGWVMISTPFNSQTIGQDRIWTSVGGIFGVTIVYIAGIEYWIRRLRRRSYPDRRALQSLLELIRETEGSIAQSRGWSALDRAQFQIRLSRLEIAPEAHPGYW